MMRFRRFWLLYRLRSVHVELERIENVIRPSLARQADHLLREERALRCALFAIEHPQIKPYRGETA